MVMERLRRDGVVAVRLIRKLIGDKLPKSIAQLLVI